MLDWVVHLKRSDYPKSGPSLGWLDGIQTHSALDYNIQVCSPTTKSSGATLHLRGNNKIIRESKIIMSLDSQEFKCILLFSKSRREVLFQLIIICTIKPTDISRSTGHVLFPSTFDCWGIKVFIPPQLQIPVPNERQKWEKHKRCFECFIYRSLVAWSRFPLY